MAEDDHQIYSSYGILQALHRSSSTPASCGSPGPRTVVPDLSFDSVSILGIRYEDSQLVCIWVWRYVVVLKLLETSRSTG